VAHRARRLPGPLSSHSSITIKTVDGERRWICAICGCPHKVIEIANPARLHEKERAVHTWFTVATQAHYCETSFPGDACETCGWIYGHHDPDKVDECLAPDDLEDAMSEEEWEARQKLEDLKWRAGVFVGETVRTLVIVVAVLVVLGLLELPPF